MQRFKPMVCLGILILYPCIQTNNPMEQPWEHYVKIAIQPRLSQQMI